MIIIIIKIITINSHFCCSSVLLIVSTLYTLILTPADDKPPGRDVMPRGVRGVGLCSLGPGGSPCCARSPAGCCSPSNISSSVSSGAPRLHQLFSAPSSSSGGGGRTSSGVPPTIHVDFPHLLPPRRDEDEVRLFFLFFTPRTLYVLYYFSVFCLLLLVTSAGAHGCSPCSAASSLSCLLLQRSGQVNKKKPTKPQQLSFIWKYLQLLDLFPARCVPASHLAFNLTQDLADFILSLSLKTCKTLASVENFVQAAAQL